MKRHTLTCTPICAPIALAAALLLSGVAAASAADAPGASSSPQAAMTAEQAGDLLNLNAVQRREAWTCLSAAANGNQKAPADFDAAVGAEVPGTLTLQHVASSASDAVPALRPYDFAMVESKLLIVNPSDKKIVEVITG
jgi:hypothetical protein